MAKVNGKTKGVGKVSKGGGVKGSKGVAVVRRARAERVEEWNLRLYVAGQTPKSLTAFANLKRLCEEHLKGRYKLEVIDLVNNPHLAEGDQILAIPTLVRKIPEPIKKIIGDLSNSDRFLMGFDLKAGTLDGKR